MLLYGIRHLLSGFLPVSVCEGGLWLMFMGYHGMISEMMVMVICGGDGDKL